MSQDLNTQQLPAAVDRPIRFKFGLCAREEILMYLLRLYRIIEVSCGFQRGLAQGRSTGER